MKSGIKYVLSLGIAWALFAGCSKPEVADTSDTGQISVNLSVSKIMLTRAPALSVNRVLVLPFQKLDPNQPNSNAANFIPAWNFAQQWDINAFPVQSQHIGLPKSFTYKVMIIGYNQNDYDYHNPNPATNRFSITDQPTPTTLANFQLHPKTPNNVPEFFICYCNATQNGTSIGSVFTPTDGTTISLSGNLKRIVSGLDVSVTNIPGFVKSVRLVAEKLAVATRLNDTIPTTIQTPAESYPLGTQIPTGNAVTFNTILLPTLAANSSHYYLDIAYGSTTQRYTILVPNTSISNNNKITLLANELANITGDYNSINFGFTIDRSINLEDDVWDGLTN